MKSTEPVFSSVRLHEIYHIKNLLEAAGIPASIRHAELCTLAGEVPFLECGAQLVLLRESDRDAALGVLEQWRRPAAPLPCWTCVGCGETLEGQFTLCWRCGAARCTD